METLGSCVNGQWETRDSHRGPARRPATLRPPLWVPHGQAPAAMEHASRPYQASGQASGAPGGHQMHAQRGGDHDGAATRPPPLPLFASAPAPAPAPAAESQPPRPQFSLHAVVGTGFSAPPARAEGEAVGLGLAAWAPPVHRPATATCTQVDNVAITQHLLREPHPLAFASRSYEEAARAAQLAAAREAQAAAAAAAAGGAGAGGQPVRAVEPRPPRRSRLRRPCARRSLSCMFDLAATLQERDQQSLQEEAAAAEAEGWAGQAGGGCGPEAMDSDDPCCPDIYSGQPGPSRQPEPAAPLLPLQHLLMSERAQHLSSLEVKAIIYRVCSDLAGRHAAPASAPPPPLSYHCAVSISCIALSPNGDLATTRLLPKSGASPDCLGWGTPSSPYASSLGALPSQPLSEPGAGACCALGFGARWAGRAQGAGGVAAAAAAYVPPEVANCGCPAAADSPAADMWSLGVVLFVLLSGGYVPFGHRGLSHACVPNMPGPTEKVDRLQEWLEAHLYHKVEVIQEICRAQAGAPLTADAISQMRVVGFDDLSRDLLLSLLRADPAQRLSAVQALRHPWLREVAGLVPGPEGPPLPSAAAPGRGFPGVAPTSSPPSPTLAGAGPSTGAGGPEPWQKAGGDGALTAPAPARHIRRLSSGSSDASAASCFSPSTPTGAIDVLTRGASVASLTPTDSVGSDTFSFSDLLLLSGAAAAVESAEGVTPPGREEHLLLLQGSYYNPCGPQQQQAQQQLHQPQPSLHDNYAAVLLASASAAVQQAQQAPASALPAAAAAATAGHPGVFAAGDSGGGHSCSQARHGKLGGHVGGAMWGQQQVPANQGFAFGGFTFPPPPHVIMQ